MNHDFTLTISKPTNGKHDRRITLGLLLILIGSCGAVCGQAEADGTAELLRCLAATMPEAGGDARVLHTARLDIRGVGGQPATMRMRGDALEEFTCPAYSVTRDDSGRLIFRGGRNNRVRPLEEVETVDFRDYLSTDPFWAICRVYNHLPTFKFELGEENTATYTRIESVLLSDPAEPSYGTYAERLMVDVATHQVLEYEAVWENRDGNPIRYWLNLYSAGPGNSGFRVQRVERRNGPVSAEFTVKYR